MPSRTERLSSTTNTPGSEALSAGAPASPSPAPRPVLEVAHGPSALERLDRLEEAVDLPIWRKARKVICVDTSPGVLRTVRGFTEPEELPRIRRGR